MYNPAEKIRGVGDLELELEKYQEFFKNYYQTIHQYVIKYTTTCGHGHDNVAIQLLCATIVIQFFLVILCHICDLNIIFTTYFECRSTIARTIHFQGKNIKSRGQFKISEKKCHIFMTNIIFARICVFQPAFPGQILYTPLVQPYA